MKSVVQEGVTVAKALNAAWEAAGCPKEFTIKVKSEGERGFLGFSKVKAVVALYYEPQDSSGSGRRQRNENNKPKRSRERSEGLYSHDSEGSRQRDDRRGSSRRSSGSRSEGSRGRSDSSRRSHSNDSAGSDRPRGLLSYEDEVEAKASQPEQTARPVSEKPVEQTQAPVSQNAPQQAAPVQDNEREAGPRGWADEYLETVRTVINDALAACSELTPFVFEEDNQTLKIFFDEPVLSEPSANRAFYASMSMLLIQILKKQHKRRFRGYRILITTKGVDIVPDDSRRRHSQRDTGGDAANS